MTKFVLDKIQNIVGKEKNAGYQHFLLFPQCFQKALSSGSLKVVIMWSRDKEMESDLYPSNLYYIQNYTTENYYLLNVTVLDWFKFKAFGNNHVVATQKLKFVS